jgi:hypothetical protein
MKIHHYFSSFCIILLTVLSGCTKYPKYDISNPPSVNETSLELYVGDKKQVTANPVGANYSWTSKNEEIAKVSQTGLVEAVGEGFTSVVVASDDDQITIDVRVRTYIPLTGVSLSQPKKLWYAEDEYENLFAFPEPADATESIVWTSSDPNVATISKGGMFTTKTAGAATITATSASGSLSQSVLVNVVSLKEFNKSEWTVLAVSSNQPNDGQGPNAIIDNNLNTYWQTNYNNPVSYPPHWALIDLGSPRNIARIEIHRRYGATVPYVDPKTVTCYVSNILNVPPYSNPGPVILPDGWQEVGSVLFPNSNGDNKQVLDITPTIGQYLLLWLPDSYRNIYDNLAEIYAYGE